MVHFSPRQSTWLTGHTNMTTPAKHLHSATVVSMLAFISNYIRASIYTLIMKIKTKMNHVK